MTMLRQFLRDTRAAAGAEMVLILPGFAFILLNVADLSRYIYAKMQVDLAAQEAAGAARVLCSLATSLPATTNCTGLTAAMQAAAQSTSLGSDVTIADPPGNAWFCANSGSELVEVMAIASAPPADCSATLTGSTAKPGEYLSAQATYTFEPIFPTASVAAALPATITRTAWIRLQ